MERMILYMSALLAVTTVCPSAAQIETDADSLVNVAFRKVAKDDVMGGVTSVNYRELTDKNYNTYSLDNMQGYAAGYNGAGLWGMTDQLVLVDGVPRAADNVKPDEIEQITFLKGAQAVVLYGSRAARGAVLITTKRGRVSDGLRVSVRANTGWNVAKSLPEYLGSAEYMTLYNEARANDGLAALYTQEQIYNYGSGRNPWRYADVDFFGSDYVKKAFNRTDATVEIEGGNERARFYSNVSYYRQGDYLNFGEAKNNSVDRFSVRGNVDIRLNDFISAYVNANASYYNSRSANSTQAEGDYWQVAASWRPNRVSPLIPLSFLDVNAVQPNRLIGTSSNIVDGRYFLGGRQTDLTNIFADYYAGGHSTWTSRQFQFDAGLDFDLGGLLRGLSLHALVGVDYATSYRTSFDNSYATFEPTWSNYGGKDVIVALDNHETVDKKSGQQNISGSADNQTIAFSAHLDYKRTLGKEHNLSAMLLANGFQQTLSGQYHKTSNANLGLRVGYDFAKRYFAELAMATPWSARLPRGKRMGFSPSLTVGWRLSKEAFMEHGAVDNLTLSVSVSDLKTDLGIDNYYMYLQTYQNGGWWDWNGGTGHSSVQSVRGGNDELTFLRRKELSATVHAELLDRGLSVDASFFASKMQGGIIAATNQVPNYFSSWHIGSETGFVPYLNYNDDTRTGFDVAVKYKSQLGRLGLQAGVNMTYYATKAAKRDDTNYADTYQYRQGQPLDAIWGYECLGFFKDQADIDASPQQILGGTIRPGDLKYKDQNGDNVIDDKDQVGLCKGGWYGSPMTLGINVTLKYCNFSLFLLGVGGFGGHGVKNNSYWWISGENKYSSVVRDRWTPATAATATYPRLTTQAGTNNLQTSDFWIYSTSRFDLAKVQLTYDFPKSVIGHRVVKGLAVYVSGSNLLTLAKERKLLELNVGSAPQARFYNLGVKVGF